MNSSRGIASLFTIAAVALAISLPLDAQTLYKCGKSFQDRPCETTAQGKAISKDASAIPQPTKATSDIGCIQRGDRAKKIMWAREVGKTKDEQLAISTSQDDRDLIEEVYRMKGTSNEVSASIEARCDEKAKLIPPSRAPVPENQGVSIPSPETRPAYGGDATNAASKKNRCDNLAASLKDIQDAERTGGSASLMDSLRKQRRNVEAQQQEAGC